MTTDQFSITRLISAAIAAAAFAVGLGMAAPSQAQAAEIVVYADPFYTGSERRFTRSEPDLSDVGFNDTIASLRVVSGTWMVCSDADYRGQCMTVTGDLTNFLITGLHDRISSIRLEGGGGAGSGGSDEAVVFSRRDFRGDRRTFDEAIPDMTREGFNDQITSMQLTGRWEVCEHTNYRGECRDYRNDHDDLSDDGWNNRISSMRPVSGGGGGGADRMVIFTDAEFEGDRETIREDIPNLGSLGMLDDVSSFRIRRGTWEVCDRRNYRGRCEIFDSNQRRLGSIGWNDRIRSIREVGGSAPLEGITLFEHTGYAGDQVHFTDNVRDLAGTGIDDAASSLRIHSGTWEICGRPDYRGRCRIFDADDSDLTGDGINDRVSSIRRVGAGGGVPLHGVTLYEHTGYAGRHVHFSDNTPDLSGTGIDDAASSLRIHSGTWELCGRPNYRGRCRIFDADDSNLTGEDLNDRVSSLRRVAGGGGGGIPPAVGITLFDGTGFSGASVTINEDIVILQTVGFGDRTSSLRIHTGVWELCKDSHYRGQCRVFTANDRDLSDNGMNNQVSSIRRVGSGGGGGSRTGIMVFEDINYRGGRLPFDSAIESLVDRGFNDRMSSFRIYTGRWELCEHVNFRGRCEVFDADVDNLVPLGLNDRISSLRPIAAGGGVPRFIAYEDGNFGGRSLAFPIDNPNLTSSGMNDKISSFRIRGNDTWEVCEHANYGGRCQRFSSNQDQLGPLNWNDRISSIRRVP